MNGFSNSRSSAVLYLTASNLFLRLLTVLFVILVPRVLGVEAFGAYSAVMAAGAILLTLSDLGSGVILVREAARRPESAAALTSCTLVCRWLIVAVLGGLALAAAGWMRLDPDKHIAFAMLVLAQLGWVSSLTVNALAQSAGDMRPTPFIPLVHSILPGFVGVGLVAMGYSWIWLVAMAVPFSVVGAVSFYRFAVRRCGFQWSWNSRDFRPFLLLIFPIACLTGIYGLTSRIDHLLLAAWTDDRQLGYYRSAYHFVDGFLILSASLLTALLPAMSRAAQADPAELRRLTSRAIHVMALVGLPAVSLVAAWSSPLITFLYGIHYAPAANVLPPLCAASALLLVMAPVGQLLIAANRLKPLLILAAIGLSVNLAANAVLIPRCGFVGAGWATLAAEALGFVLLERVLRQTSPGVSLWRGLSGPLPAFIVFSLALFFLKSHVGWWSSPLALILYLAVLRMSGGLDADDIAWMRSFMTGKNPGP